MKGIGISEGIAIGRAWVVKEPVLDFSAWPDTAQEQEMVIFCQARARLSERLSQRAQRAAAEGQKAREEIMEAHGMMLEDPEFEAAVQKAVGGGQKLPEAVTTVLGGFAALMNAMEDPYLQQRSQDYLDIRSQFLKELAGVTEAQEFEPGTRWIPTSEDFTPSDISLVDNPSVQGFLCQGGAATTHFSILAKIGGVPAVMQVPGLLDRIAHGDMIILDGATGEVHLDPEPSLIAAYEKKQQAFLQYKESLDSLKTEASVTRDGRICHLEGNIAGVQDLSRMLENGAEGIGLFRTEFIYMERTAPPSETEQAAIYSQVLAGMGGKPVVIRTLDVGGDKELPYLNIKKEDNPFLGFRAVRYCLAHPEIFKTQLRALLRASASGALHIMVPMISGLEEVRSVRALLSECREELIGEGISLGEDIQLGIMIEVPAAAAMASLLAEEVDFFSIGTNDLIQYVMAADRMNAAVAYLYTPYHPAFLRTLKSIIDGAHSAGIPAAMCGELAGDPDFIPVLVGLGLDRYSMNVGALLKARLRIRTLDEKACQELVSLLLTLRTEREIKAAVEAFGRRYPL